MLARFTVVTSITIAALLVGAAILHLLPRLGRFGRVASDAMCRAPALDWLITYFTVAPLIVGPIFAGWIGLSAGVTAQIVALVGWTIAHELAHPEARRGPRIIKVVNRMTGTARNLSACAVTAIVVPVFWVIRLAEVFLYPMLTKLVGLPPYRTQDWVNVSRHKFSGLVGHDRIWCLYCDWMTGVWSLGTEMLRNVESFWCPIKFASGAKCDHCKIDFPDIAHGWVPASGTMQEVTATLEEQYGGGSRAWFGSPTRITVRGREIAEQSADREAGWSGNGFKRTLTSMNRRGVVA